MRKLWEKLYVCAFVASVLGGGGCSHLIASDAEKPVFKAAEAVIVEPDKLTNWEQYAVADLRKCIGQVVGKEFKVVKESEVPADAKAAIYVGMTNAAKAAGIDWTKLMSQEYRIKAIPGKMFIVGGSSVGTTYGVYDFLQRQCVFYFLTPDECNLVPNTPDLSVTAQDITWKPQMWVRTIEHAMNNGYKYPVAKKYWDDYGRHSRWQFFEPDVEPQYWLSGQVFDCHTFYKYVQPEKYFKDHPEYFSAHPNGKRAYQPAGQLCLSNPDVLKITLASLEAFIEKDRKARPTKYPTMYELSQEDNTSFICCCPECKKIADQYGGDSGLVIWFVNQVAREIARKYPDVHLRTFAYVSSEKPPTGIKPEKNVVVRYCDLYSKCSHQYPLTNAFNHAHGQDTLLKDWCAMTPNVELWDYMLYGGTFPEISVDALAADAKFFHEIGMNRIFMESECLPNSPQPFYDLHLFIMTQMYYDPSQNLEKLIDVFCQGYYGKAAKEMREYIDLLRKIIATNPPESVPAWHARAFKWLNPDNLEKFTQMLKTALAKDSDAKVRARISNELANVSYARMKIYRTLPGSGNQFKSACDDYRAAMKEAPYLRLDSEKNLKARAASAENAIALMSLTFDDLPAELAKVPSSDMICVGNRQLSFDPNAKCVKDPDSTMPYAGVWKFDRPQGGPVNAGVYDTVSKMNFPATIHAEKAQDEKYHWYKLEKPIRIGRGAIFYMKDWNLGFFFNDFYTECDGMAVDPNWYDLWVSIKVAGPGYVKDSTRKNGLYLDRAALVRVPPPTDKR